MGFTVGGRQCSQRDPSGDITTGKEGTLYDPAYRWEDASESFRGRSLYSESAWPCGQEEKPATQQKAKRPLGPWWELKRRHPANRPSSISGQRNLVPTLRFGAVSSSRFNSLS